MHRYATPLTAALAAILLTFGSIGGLVTVPQAQLAMSPFVPTLV